MHSLLIQILRQIAVLQITVHMSAALSLSLDYNLFARNFSCDPVYQSNGGVADLKIIHKGEKIYASELFRPEILVSLLNKWEGFTRQRPAYKVVALQETKERMLQAQQQRESKGFKM